VKIRINTSKGNKTYSYRDPHINYDTDDSTSTEKPPDTPLSDINPDDIPDEMAGGSADINDLNLSKDTKKKLKTPTPFSGKREDLRKFL
jgi:hypothetical protein